AAQSITEVTREPIFFYLTDMDVHVRQSGNDELAGGTHNPRTRGNMRRCGWTARGDPIPGDDDTAVRGCGSIACIDQRAIRDRDRLAYQCGMKKTSTAQRTINCNVRVRQRSTRIGRRIGSDVRKSA